MLCYKTSIISGSEKSWTVHAKRQWWSLMWEVVCQRAFFLHLWCILATGYYLNNEGSILHLFMQTQRSQENKMIHLSPFSDIILFMDICLKSNPQNCVNPIIDGPSKIDGSWLVLINQSSGKNIFMLPTFTDFHIFQQFLLDITCIAQILKIGWIKHEFLYHHVFQEPTSMLG